ncbi:uncharacterized protein LOC122082263 [Macadamia integrifolia]|uniref:uncharacterized protein LOC122082263 n=1 Tax=Macadamia integrifolia TaxID=60698 RepID=UPI001C4F5E30|nr:uncharacterized protein LOC122082263 [Macadamia integrifolia]
MGYRSLSFIGIIVSLFLSSFAQNLQDDSARISLDVLLQQYAYKALVRPHTAILYKASLPAKFSGMKTSVIRFRSGSLWARGANVSAFRLPPRIISQPFVKRLAIVYQNLGNWSSNYYSVPGYSLVTPVIGFRVYDASNLSSKTISSLNLNVTRDPISVHFPQFQLPPGSNSTTVRCVTFNLDGTVSLSKMTIPNVCFTHNQGHFSIVVEQPKMNVSKARRLWKLWKWWVIGLCGFVGLVLGFVVAMLVVRLKKAKKFLKMERKADQGESFKTIWIGPNKMPSAAVTRTHPVLENGYVP